MIYVVAEALLHELEVMTATIIASDVLYVMADPSITHKTSAFQVYSPDT